MAQIRSVFTLIDNVSPALRKMLGASNSLNASLNDLQDKSGLLPNNMNNMGDSMDRVRRSSTNLVRTLVGMSSAIAILSNISTAIGIQLGRLNALVKEYEEAVQGETMLTAVMRQRMNATEDMVDSVTNLAQEMQKSGIYDADMIVGGAQELATYVSTKEALEELIPAMVNLVAQRQGYVATTQDFVSAATMMGKVIQGMTGSLQRVGYVFSEDEKRILETGTEMERAAMLAQIITQNVGQMNEALANTPIGSIMQATNRINDVKEAIGEALADTKRQFTVFRANVYDYVGQAFTNVVNSINIDLANLMHTITLVGAVMVTVGGLMSLTWLGMHPIFTLVIVSISAIIKVIRQFGATSRDVLSVFTGLIGGIVGFIQSAFNVIYNVVATVFNFVARVAEALANVLVNPFKTLASVILSIVQFILEALSTVIGVIEMFTGSDISGKLAGFASKIEQLKDEMWGDTRDVRFGTVELENVSGDVTSMVSAGMDVGADIDKLINESFTPQQYADAFAKGADGSLLTSSKNEIILVNEMKELLARRALQEYIVKVSQVTPQMTIENINISETADADAVIETLANGYAETVDSTLGGQIAYD